MSATAVLVARQSRGTDDSMSVPDQLAKMRGECERQGWQVGGVYEEPDVSGRRPLFRRQGLRKAVTDVEEGRAQIVLVAYFDRLARSLKVQAEVVERVEAAKGRVLALDAGAISNGSAAQWLSSTMLGMMAEYYSRSSGERVSENKQRCIDAGIPPFPNVTVAFEKIPDGPRKGALRPSEWAPVVAEAVRMRAGVDRVAPAPWTELQRLLAEQGLRLSLKRIRVLVDSRLLIGEIHFGEFPPNLPAHERIVDPAVWRKAQEATAPKGRLGHSERLLARLGVLVCGTCGSRMVVCSSRNRYGVYRYYRCMKDFCERQAGVMCDTAEVFVRDEAVRLAADTKGRASALEDLEAARLALEDASGRLDAAIRTLAGMGGEEATRDVLEGLQADRDARAARYEHLVAVTAPDLTVTGAGWETMTFDERRRVIRAVVARAVVAPGKGPGRIRVEGRESLA